jgi:hypothetical protein
MKRILVCATLVMAFGVLAAPTASAAPERLTYHCTQELATNIEPIEFRPTGLDGQVTHLTQHGVAAFNCPGLGTGNTELWVHGNLNPTYGLMLQGSSVMTFTGGAGGFELISVAHGSLVPIPAPPGYTTVWTGTSVGQGFGSYEGWQYRSTDVRDLVGITHEVEIFQPGK